VKESTNQHDEQLIARIRDLSIVDLQTLQRGAAADGHQLVALYAQDALSALVSAGTRCVELRTAMAKLDTGSALLSNPRARKSGEGRAAALRIANTLRQRAELARCAARIDEVAAALWSPMLAAERMSSL
jgi:hypothetical protein